MLIYCDSAILMYFFDHFGTFHARATTRLAAATLAGDRLAISDLVRLEYRIKPLVENDTTKLALFQDFCSQSDVHKVPIATDAFERATIIRATHGFKLADSLHLAAAIEGKCDRFLTNDARLATFVDIPVEVLP